MKIAISIGVAVVMPFGFFVLAGVILSRMLARRRHARRLDHRADQLQAAEPPSRFLARSLLTSPLTCASVC
jgi:hypothetical protein